MNLPDLSCLQTGWTTAGTLSEGPAYCPGSSTTSHATPFVLHWFPLTFPFLPTHIMSRELLPSHSPGCPLCLEHPSLAHHSTEPTPSSTEGSAQMGLHEKPHHNICLCVCLLHSRLCNAQQQEQGVIQNSRIDVGWVLIGIHETVQTCRQGPNRKATWRRSRGRTGTNSVSSGQFPQPWTGRGNTSLGGIQGNRKQKQRDG